MRTKQALRPLLLSTSSSAQLASPLGSVRADGSVRLFGVPGKLPPRWRAISRRNNGGQQRINARGIDRLLGDEEHAGKDATLNDHREAEPIYIMGHSAEERERLIAQAGLYGPISERFLRASGLRPGMRVLDVGCGVGDVSLLCAEIVGLDGAVVGVDRDPAALERARERVRSAGLEHVQFQEGDFREIAVDEPFDAIVGRAVLMYAPDPVAALRALLPHLRQGGIVAFQEFDYTSLIAVPPSRLYDQLADWWRQLAHQAGIELQMGFKLFPAFKAAGLPDPVMHGDTILGGGADFAGYDYLTGVFRSVLPLLERFGVATSAEVDVATLADRLRADRVATGGVVMLQMIVGATARR
jgi:SAM-dependent methyltransferase